MPDDLSLRLEKLEEQVRALSAVSKAESRSKPCRLLQSLVAHWVLVTAAVALALLLVVRAQYGVFGIPFMEDARKAAGVKRRAAFHRELGKRSIRVLDWEAARESFLAAVELDPSDLEAHFGVLQAEVFEPLEGQSIADPELIRNRLVILEKELPHREAEAAKVLWGVYYMSEGEFALARDQFGEALRRKPDCIAAYAGLGQTQLLSGDVDGAQRSFDEVVKYEERQFGSKSAFSANNLGYLHLVSLQFEAAVSRLLEAHRLSPKLIIELNLGEALRYSGNAKAALAIHQLALDAVSDEDVDIWEERFAKGLWLHNYMPLSPTDTTTIEKFLAVSTKRDKLAILHAALSIDHALLSSLVEADDHFASFMKLAERDEVRAFVANRISFARWLAKPPLLADDWLARQERLLASEQAGQ